MKFYIIDGSSYCYRAYHALPSLSNSKGQPTGAVYGFVTMLKKLLQEKPDYLAVCFDLKVPTFRHKVFAGYKGKRPPMPEELVSQLDLIKETISAFRIPAFAKEGYEADDILATLADRFAGENLEVYLVTGDKDMLQIVNSYIKIYNTEIYDVEKVKENYGVEPDKIPEILALMGDSADNIPGVPGVGEKTATELIKRFNNVEGIYSNLDELEKKTLKENLVKYKQQIREALGLLRLRKDVPVDAELKDLKCKPPDEKRLFEIYRELEFKNLMRELPPLEKVESVSYDLSDAQNADIFFKRLKDAKEIVLYLAGSQENGYVLAFSIEQGSAFYLPLMFRQEDGYELFSQMKDVRYPIPEELRIVLEDEKIKKAGHDLKTLKLSLYDFNVELKGLYFDTMLVAYLSDPGKSEYELEELGLDYFGCSLQQPDEAKMKVSLSEAG